MPSTNTTPLGLSLWEGPDRPKRKDFNADNNKIDLACRSMLENLSSHLESKAHITSQQAVELLAAKTHTIEGVATEAGMHGIRFFADRLQVNVGGLWMDCATAGTGQQAYKVYGVCIDSLNPDAFSAVTYTDDAVGMEAGSSAWDGEELFASIRPCMLQNGARLCYLDPTDYSKREDGGVSGHNSGAHGDVMVEIPRMAYAIYYEGDMLHVKVTLHPDATQLDPRFCYLAHTRGAEGDRQRLYVGAYLAASVDGKLRSLSGQTALRKSTVGNCRALAKANGDGYDLLGFYPYTLLQCLYLIRYKALDCQTALGNGYTGGTAPVPTGGTDTAGLYYGDVSDKIQVKCLGIEDLWGNLATYLDGALVDETGQFISACQNFSDERTGYQPKGLALTDSLSGVCHKVHGTNTMGFLAKETGLINQNYFDVVYVVKGRVLSGGGNYLTRWESGIFSINGSIAITGTDVKIGGRIMYL